MINCFPLKTKIFTYTFFTLFLLFLVACSTRKNTFLSRNSHALSTRDNILYNGQISLDKGVESIKNNNKDNYWKRLPIEKMQFKESDSANAKSKNPDFEAAEAKATKAIQKHSMYIEGQEKNYQIDEAYLLLGKARYYDQRFFPALEAFNYILYKSSTSSKINPAKIWREKTNMRLGNDAQVLKNITKLLKDKRLKQQVVADANAILAESFLNLEQKDSAVVRLKIAERATKINSQRARYRFILGQLYQELGVKDTALIYYQSVIDMNRKADRDYVIQAHAKQAQLFDFENGDKEAFLIRFNKLLEDRENKPFRDVIYYEMGVFYDKNNNQELANKFYNESLKLKPTDAYLMASNYRNLGNMYFKNVDYFTAAKYYDSTLVKLDAKTREHIHIKKVRKDLDEVIQFETIAKTNDSILNVLSMTDANKIQYYEDYIIKLKKADEEKRLLAEKQKEIEKNIDINNISSDDDVLTAGVSQGSKTPPKKSFVPPNASNPSNNAANIFYFYNPSTVAFGKIEFKKKFGIRTLEGNWRMTPTTKNSSTESGIDGDIKNQENNEKETVVEEKPEYTASFYIDMLPKEQTKIDSIAKGRNFAYYQLGTIYKEKLKEFKLASTKFEQLLQQNPEEKLVLPAMYNLYKIYQVTDISKAEEMKNRISVQYPDSRYAQIINSKKTSTVTALETAESEYKEMYKLFEEEQFVTLLEKIDRLIIQYYGDQIIPKFELLKANAIGKYRGLESYKTALLFVADNYATTEEGKNAQEILTTQVPIIEKINFTSNESKNWKILYKIDKNDDKTLKNIEEKFKKYIADEDISWLTLKLNPFNEKEDFLVIEGLKSQAFAYEIADNLKNYKKYKLINQAIVISNENFKVLQIKKNIEQYNAFKNLEINTYKKPEAIRLFDNSSSPQDKELKPKSAAQTEEINNEPSDATPEINESAPANPSKTPEE